MPSAGEQHALCWNTRTSSVSRDTKHAHDVTHTRTTKRIQWGFAQKPEAASSFLI